MVVLVLLGLVAAIAIGMLLYKKWVYSYWERKGVYTFKPTEGIFININVYNIMRQKGLKYGGIYQSSEPYFVTTDLDLLKCVLIKNFDHFVNHGLFYNAKDDPLSATLENLEDMKWKQSRSMITPAFSTGKLKQIIPTLLNYSKSLLSVLNDYAESNQPVFIRDVIQRFITDAIGSSSFGIELDTLHNKNDDFRLSISKTNEISWRTRVPGIINWKLLKLLRFRTTRYQVYGYFRDLVKKVTEYREQHDVNNRDLFQYLLQLKNNENNEDSSFKKRHKLTLDEMIAQSFSFFIGALESSSILMSFALFEIATNPDIQDKLRKHVKEYFESNGGCTYEAIRDMYYLEWVINETLRKYPPAYTTGRLCNKKFRIPDTDIVIDPGVKVVVPIFAIHMDPEYYEDPTKFDPERFSPENRAKRHPLSFVPFGAGPRSCIGNRLGMIEAKIGLATVISNFKITLSEKTKVPITYRNDSLLLAVEGGIWLKLEKI